MTRILDIPLTGTKYMMRSIARKLDMPSSLRMMTVQGVESGYMAGLGRRISQSEDNISVDSSCILEIWLGKVLALYSLYSAPKKISSI